MAVTRKGQVIRMVAAGDAVTDDLIIQAIHAEGDLTLKDGAGTTLFATGSGTTDLSFPFGWQVRGLEMDAGTGELVVFLK